MIPRFSITGPKPTRGGRSTSTLTLGPIQIQHNAYNIKCIVNYHSNPVKNFHGGKVSSEEFELKVMHIKSFLVVSKDTIVVNDDVDLVCWAYGPPNINKTFELKTDTERWFHHFHTKAYNGDGENYREDYKVEAQKVLVDGVYIFCTVGA